MWDALKRRKGARHGARWNRGPRYSPHHSCSAPIRHKERHPTEPVWLSRMTGTGTMKSVNIQCNKPYRNDHNGNNKQKGSEWGEKWGGKHGSLQEKISAISEKWKNNWNFQIGISWFGLVWFPCCVVTRQTPHATSQHRSVRSLDFNRCWTFFSIRT